MRSRRILGILILLVQVFTFSLLAAQAPLDPQSLVGEWTGNWTLSVGGGGRTGGREGPYVLTIKRVAGDRVFASLETLGQSRDIGATLSGNQLTFGNEQFRTVLAVDGDEMRGTRQGGGVPQRDIVLRKKK